MRIHLLIALMRLRLLYRRGVWHVGLYLQQLGRSLIVFGEKEIRNSWDALFFARAPLAQIEIIACFNKVYRGTIIAACFEHSKYNAEKRVVFHLNWIAESRGLSLPYTNNQWVFGGLCDVIVDPIASPLHLLPDGTYWFMWPNGNYARINFNYRTHLSFAGDKATPRLYTYF